VTKGKSLSPFAARSTIGTHRGAEVRGRDGVVGLLAGTARRSAGSERRRPAPSIVLTVALVTASSIGGCASAIDDDWETFRRSVVRLVVGGDEPISTGTAFAVSDAGHYVTNFHVVADAVGGELHAVESVNPARKSHPASVIWSDEERDLAVVHVPSWSNPPLELLPSDEVHVNRSVLSIGFPGSSDVLSGIDNPGWTVPTLKRGIVSESIDVPLENGEGSRGLVEHSAVVNSGNSGGPLVDECGRVIGVNVAKATSSFDLADALDSAMLTGIGEARVDIQEGAYFAIRSDDLIAGLEGQAIPFSVARRPCLGERLAPRHFIAGFATLVCLFATALLGLFLYFRRRFPEERFAVGRATRMLVTGTASAREGAAPESVPKARVYRGDGGEIVHQNALRLASVAGHAQSVDLLPGVPVTIGRNPNENDLAVLDERVSRRHARVTLDTAGTVRVVDLASTHGTYLDGERVGDEPPGSVMGGERRLLLGSEDVVFMLIEPRT